MLSDHRGVAFTPVASPSHQRSRVAERQHSSDTVVGNNTIRMVTFQYTLQFSFAFLSTSFYNLDLCSNAFKFETDMHCDVTKIHVFCSYHHV